MLQKLFCERGPGRGISLGRILEASFRKKKMLVTGTGKAGGPAEMGREGAGRPEAEKESARW